MYEKMVELLALLRDRTRAGKVEWEYLADDEMVRASVGKGLIRIGRDADVSLRPRGGAELAPATVYQVWVIGSNGSVTEQFIVTPLEPRNYELVSQLYEEARSTAQDSSKVLQTMIEALRAG